MKTNFTTQEALDLIHLLQHIFEIVRLVNPVARHVLDMETNEDMQDICHSLWGRCDRCENCTSIRALQSHHSAYKIEFMNEKVFLVMSKYLNVDGKDMIMEIVSDASEDFMANTDQKDKLAQVILQNNKLVILDSLTGLYNRRFLDQYFIPSLQCCHELGTVVNIALLDIDKFKEVNDTYGHQAGDHLIKDVAGFWKLHFNQRLKNKDQLVIRYGGDEILIVSCGISYQTFKDRIYGFYGDMRKICYYDSKAPISFTISIGTASTEEFSQDDWTWQMLFGQADHRMYKNKTDDTAL